VRSSCIYSNILGTFRLNVIRWGMYLIFPSRGGPSFSSVGTGSTYLIGVIYV